MPEQRTDVPGATVGGLHERYGGPGPRYTSYPSAVEFHEGVGPDAHREALVRAGREEREPLSLYFHVPFCSALCLYCGCNVTISRSADRMGAYVRTLGREIDLVVDALGARRGVAQLHLGGGSPNWLPPQAITTLVGMVRERFDVLPEAEVAIELDPRTLDEAYLDLLRDLRFNRLSFGCQDFTPEVQAAVRRFQPLERTRALVEHAKRIGLGAISIDLMTGLPEQRIESFGETLDAVVGMAPARVSVFPYAHVPWLRPHQRVLERHGLPTALERIALAELARDRLVGAGYVAIGMDHYAHPDDSLAVALREGRLHRNFQGYTVGPAMDLLGIGVTSISDVSEVYAQNVRSEPDWTKAIESGRLATERGFVLSADDVLRRKIIRAILCDYRLDFRAVERREGIRFEEAFAKELDALRTLVDDRLVEVSPDGLTVTPTGRPFVRAVAMAFDAYSARRLAVGSPAFSKIA